MTSQPLSISRRGFLGAAAATAAAGRGRAAPRANIESVGIISQQPAYFHGWPTLARRKNGELLAGYSGGREGHICPFGRVELTRSQDSGRTWSWPQVLLDSPVDDRDGGVVETPKGSILVTTFTSLAYERRLGGIDSMPADRAERWRAFQRAATDAQRRSLLGSWMLRSTDGGLTWSAPYRVPVMAPHGPVPLRDGRMLYAAKLYPGEPAVVGAWASADDGLSWKRLGLIPTRPGDDVARYHELHAVEAADGRIVAHIRNENKAHERETLQSESSDGGKTWTVPRTIGVWGLPSHLIRLRDGRLLMTYGYRREPRGNRARLSEDHGRTWSEPVVLSDDGTGDLGYPSTVELPDGKLLTLWYEQMRPDSSEPPPPRRPPAVLRLARWSLAG